ncbi:MAG: hypothetical protein KDD64_12020 [Bdellovibrionales bacterium]|nr:hypothetical protein [Bdellovibrionales bacterium]
MSSSHTSDWATSSRFSRFFELDEILHTEKGFARGPERALFAAVLFDGIQTYFAYLAAENEEQQKTYREAYRWVHEIEDEYLFSFENVCEGLGVDPDYVRLGLLNLANSGHIVIRRSKKLF